MQPWSIHVRIHDARENRIHRDPAWTERLGKMQGERIDGTLGDVVSHNMRVSDPRNAGGNVDDAPVVTQERQGLLHQEERCFYIYGKRLIEAFLGRLFKGLGGSDACVIHQNIETVVPVARRSSSFSE